MVKKSEEQPKKKWFTKKNIFIGVLVALFLIQYVQMQTLFGNFSFLQGRDSSLIEEIGQIKEAYLELGGDLNEVRDFLRLETKNYSVFGNPENLADEEGKNENEVQLALFQYMDFLTVNKKAQENLTHNKDLLEQLASDQEFGGFLREQNLANPVFAETDEATLLNFNTLQGANVLSYQLTKADGKLHLQTVQGEKLIDTTETNSLVTDTTTFLTENQENILSTIEKIVEQRAEISAAINSTETQKIITNLKITLPAQPLETGNKLTYPIANLNGEAIGEIVFDKSKTKLTLVDLKDVSATLEVTDISTALVPFLQKLDTKNVIEKKVAESLAAIKGTINDNGFKLLLQQSGFTVTQEPREDDERYYFDVKNADGMIVSMLAVEKATGVINIVQPDGTNAENLLFFDPEFKKKTLEIPDQIPDYGDDLSHDDKTFNVLIAGKHGNLVDTMIFAHIDETRRDVRMISIPRDLQYNGRKINSFAYYYGMPELQKVLSNLTGYELDKYILIDMYAFIDVIDLVGGIDVTLEKPVIDPTYRTVDNGVVGTLHYEPGDYHLGGVEALRLARSRHTSSDFARAERQQLILEALQEKARNFGFGDADTIYEIAKTVLAKTETNISIDEAIPYYFRYQNYEIVSNNVMSSGNVLYSPPYTTLADCQSKIAAAQAANQPVPGCMNENQAYILIPKNNDWNIIKWYFKENFDPA